MTAVESDRRKRLRKIRVYGLLIALIGVMMFPFYTMFTTTLKPKNDVFAVPATVVPDSVSFRAYIEVFSQTDILLWVGNSILIAVSTVVLSLLLAIPAAYATARNDFVGKRFFMLAVLTVQMFAPVILIIGLFRIIVQYGLMNTYLAVIIPSAAFTLPFNIWMLYGYFQTIPVELEESARIDGATQYQVLRMIVLPLAKPALVASITYTFLYAWNRLLFVLVFLTDAAKYNIPRGIFSMVGLLNVPWQQMMTASVIGIVPVLIMFAFLEEYIVTGMTSGAVKE